MKNTSSRSTSPFSRARSHGGKGRFKDLKPVKRYYDAKPKARRDEPPEGYEGRGESRSEQPARSFDKKFSSRGEFKGKRPLRDDKKSYRPERSDIQRERGEDYRGGDHEERRNERPARSFDKKFSSRGAFKSKSAFRDDKKSYHPERSVSPREPAEDREDRRDDRRKVSPERSFDKKFSSRGAFKSKGAFRDDKKSYRPERSEFQRDRGEDRKEHRKEHRDDPRDNHRDNRRDDRRSASPARSFDKKFSPRGDFKLRKPFSKDKKTFRPDSRPASLQGASTADKASAEHDLMWGLHAVRAAWINPKRHCSRLWLTEAGKQSFALSMAEADQNLLKRPTPKIVERHELDQITPPGSVHQGIVLETSPLPEPLLQDLISGDTPADLLLMLDQVTDPHNVGAILRSAAAFGAKAVIMTERNAPNMTGVLAKSASGAVEHVPQIHVVNLSRTLDELQQAGYWCVGLAEEGTKDLSELDLSGRMVLVMGAEGDGLRQLTRKKCNELARLPTGGAIGSLNVSNAAAISLYETRRQKKKFQK